MKSKNENRIGTFTDLFIKAVVDPSQLISIYIMGHLMIEFLLVKIVEIHPSEPVVPIEKLTHYGLINHVYGLGLLSHHQKDALLAINKVRNKFAHEITYTPTVSEFSDLFMLAARGFDDMTDGFEQGRDELDGKDSLADCEELVFSELFMQISYGLHGIYHRLGGDIEEFS